MKVDNKIEELSTKELTEINGGFGLLTLPFAAFYAGYRYFHAIN